VIGRRLPLLVAGAGLADVGLNICQPAALSGSLKHLNRVTMERIREDTLVALPRMVQAWGRRPV
jgi:hypothetical protein